MSHNQPRFCSAYLCAHIVSDKHGPHSRRVGAVGSGNRKGIVNAVVTATARAELRKIAKLAKWSGLYEQYKIGELHCI